jgi:DNA-binding MarR family transcriptional regulator
MDLLAAITGSRVRADVLAALFSSAPRSWNASELGRAARRPHQLVERELKRLAGAGFVRAWVSDRRRRYDPETGGPAARELARFVRQSRGRIPRIRHALVGLRSRTLAWAVPGSVFPAVAGRGRPRSALVVLTSAPRSLVRVQLAHVAGDDLDIQCMSVREWVTRLDKGDVLLRRVRRSRKVWVLGSWEDLAAREQAELESRRILRSAMVNWREELSDEWDDDWDPFAPAPGVG